MKTNLILGIAASLFATSAFAGHGDLINRALSNSLNEHANIQREYKAEQRSDDSAPQRNDGRGAPLNIEIHVDASKVRVDSALDLNFSARFIG